MRKAYNLLAFLFGYGFAMQAMRAKQKDINLLPFALRRALGLFILGTLHAILLRDGDIVAPYAICSLFIFHSETAVIKKYYWRLQQHSSSPSFIFLC
jgi:uncharacterized membrane protein YeiB